MVGVGYDVSGRGRGQGQGCCSSCKLCCCVGDNIRYPQMLEVEINLNLRVYGQDDVGVMWWDFNLEQE